MSCNWNIKAPVTAQNEQTWLWLKSRRKKGWSGCFIRVKSEWIWPLYLAVPFVICFYELLPYWGQGEGWAIPQSLFQNRISIQGNSWFPRQFFQKQECHRLLWRGFTNHGWSVSLWCAASFSSWSWGTLEWVHAWEMPWALQGQWHGVKGWGYMHLTLHRNLDLLSLIWKPDSFQS